MNWGHMPLWLGINGEQVGDNALVTPGIPHLIRQNIVHYLCAKNTSSSKSEISELRIIGTKFLFEALPLTSNFWQLAHG